MFEQVSHNLQDVKAQPGQMVERISTQIHQTVGRGVTSAVNDSFQSWLNAHPTINWTISHPLWALGLVLMTIFLFWGLLRAIAQFIEQIWIAVLRSPLLLIRGFVGLGKGVYQQAIAGAKEISIEPETSSEQRLTEILNRLEILRKEEDELLQEVKTLLASIR